MCSECPNDTLLRFFWAGKVPPKTWKATWSNCLTPPSRAGSRSRRQPGGFVGRIDQRPPVFSALKIRGRPAYKLARQGDRFRCRPGRWISIGIDVKSYRYPELVLEIECGGGTYIRSLGRDLAESLGTAAVMSALVRTAIGRFSVCEAVSPRELTRDSWLTFLRPPLQAIDLLRASSFRPTEATRIRNGLTIVLKREDEPMAARPARMRCPPSWPPSIRPVN